eukprot:GHRR01026218.1.p1 GENE.GHRR01026218.1~~GHRR01026218.1.p1  ORF type:complete len:131 (-),score=28.08 GHRR01026218.1:51-443(-)
MQANLIMGGGPHIATMASGPEGSRCSRTISSLIKPLLYFQPSAGGLSSVYQSLKLGCFAARASNSSLKRMSSSAWLAYSRDTSVVSSGLSVIVLMTCQHGVMPVPPAIKLMRLQAQPMTAAAATAAGKHH